MKMPTPVEDQRAFVRFVLRAMVHRDVKIQIYGYRKVNASVMIKAKLCASLESAYHAPFYVLVIDACVVHCRLSANVPTLRYRHVLDR